MKFIRKTLKKGTAGYLLLCMFLLFSVSIIPVRAQGTDQGSETLTAAGTEQNREHPARLVDEAGLLSDGELQELSVQLDEISERQQCDVVIVTISSLGRWGPTTYADNYYDDNGYGMGSGNDGIMLLIAISERKWAISTCGFGITAFTDAGQEYIVEQFLSDLSAGNYYDAFEIFAGQADGFLTQARKGKAYDKGHLPVTAANIAFCVAVGLFAGFILALLRVLVMKRRMKTVYSQAAAFNYLVSDSIRFQERSDCLVRKTVKKIYVKPAESSGGGSSVHTSSSGTSHGGSSGSF